MQRCYWDTKESVADAIWNFSELSSDKAEATCRTSYTKHVTLIAIRGDELVIITRKMYAARAPGLLCSFQYLEQIYIKRFILFH